MDDEQFKACMEMDDPTIEYIESIATEKKRKSDEENKTAHENNAKVEEEKRKAEEAEKKKVQMEEDGKFPSDDFFNNVFNSATDNSKDEGVDLENNSSDSSNTNTENSNDN